MDKEIKTLYIWWGTPSRIWVERIIDIVEYIATKFDLENMAEFSIELNPSPAQEVLDFVKKLNHRYAKFPRVRFSFGIQSLDDEILKTVWRAYSFVGITDFLRKLVHLKQDNNVFNFDFIAFGKFHVSKNGTKQLRHDFNREFFQKFLESGRADSISLYTLEHHENSKRYSDLIGIENWKLSLQDERIEDWKWCNTYWEVESLRSKDQALSSDENIMEEFIFLKDIILHAWFSRYEISNFTKASKASIHNMVYRNMENYLGLGLSASSFLPMTNDQWLMTHVFPSFQNSIVPSFWTRWTNTADMKTYLEGNRVDEKQVQTLDNSDLLIEEFFLSLRTREGIADIDKFKDVLIPNYKWLITNYEWAWLVLFDWTKLQLTDEGMNVSNTIVTELLREI